MKWFSSIFWYSLVLFIANQLLEQAGIFIPFVHSYLDDLLCPPIVLGFALFVQQQFTYQNPQYKLSRGMVLFFAVWYSLIFEVILPLNSIKFHADVFDVVAYLVGSYIFFNFGNRPAKSLIFQKTKPLKMQ